MHLRASDLAQRRPNPDPVEPGLTLRAHAADAGVQQNACLALAGMAHNADAQAVAKIFATYAEVAQEICDAIVLERLGELSPDASAGETSDGVPSVTANSRP